MEMILKQNYVEYGNLKPSDTFEYQGCFYMVINRKKAGNYISVSIEDGKIIDAIKPGMRVALIHIKAIYKY